MVSCFLANLSGCGFHLRGSTVLPASYRSVQLIAAESPFKAALISGLQALRVQVTDRDASRIRILSVQPIRQQMAGRIVEVQVGVIVQYQLESAAGQPLGGVRTVEARRSYQFDTRAISNQGQQEATLMEESYRDAARQLIRQISTDRSLRS